VHKSLAFYLTVFIENRFIRLKEEASFLEAKGGGL